MSHCIYHLLQNLTEKRPWVNRYMKKHGLQRLTLFSETLQAPALTSEQCKPRSKAIPLWSDVGVDGVQRGQRVEAQHRLCGHILWKGTKSTGCFQLTRLWIRHFCWEQATFPVREVWGGGLRPPGHSRCLL